jgi:hypothetical protein
MWSSGESESWTFDLLGWLSDSCNHHERAAPDVDSTKATVSLAQLILVMPGTPLASRHGAQGPTRWLTTGTVTLRPTNVGHGFVTIGITIS